MDKPKLKEVFNDLLKAYYTLKLESEEDPDEIANEIREWNQRFKQAFYGIREGFIDECLERILGYQKQIDTAERESLEHAYLLAEQNVYIGRLASELAREYKMIYARRKQVQAEAEIRATKNKKAHGELAVADLREEEADAYGDWIRYRNAFDSTRENIHAIKIKHRVVDQGWNDANHNIGG